MVTRLQRRGGGVIGKGEGKKGRTARHIEQQTLRNLPNAGIIPGIHPFISGTRVSNIVGHRFQASAEISETINKGNSRSIL